MSTTPQELSRIYRRRFVRTSEYRNQVWQVLTRHFFNRWVRPEFVVLDLGCGYGEFINNIAAAKKHAMDLNPEARGHLVQGVNFIEQDCSAPWAAAENSLDVVFSSNFFEHLPDKACLNLTLRQALLALKPGGRLIAMGPNIKYLPGEYWDFYDHSVILTELSLAEALELEGFVVEKCVPRFLPFTMVNVRRVPLIFVRLYVSIPWLWLFMGKQFLLVAQKPNSSSSA